jgi:Tetratricopeptide repeat
MRFGHQKCFSRWFSAAPTRGRRTSQRLLSLDPLNPFSRVQPIWQAYFSRRYDESIGHANNLRELWPGNIMAPFFLATNHAVERMPAEVGLECGKVMAMVGANYAMQLIGQCAWAYAAVGRTDEARRLVERLERPPAGVWLDPVVMGQVYGALGNIDRAIEWFQRGLAERSPNMIYIKASPAWDPIRGDPRYQTLLRQMNFPS